MRPEGRRELVELVPVVHGGDAPAGILDFSTGISPLAPPAHILRAACEADVTRYPPADALPLREALSALHEWGTDGIVAGAGSVELIWAVARAFGGAGRMGVVITPAFGEYERALRVSGAEFTEVRTVAPSFMLSLNMLERVFERGSVSLVFICRPSNPCLAVFSPDLIHAAAKRWPQTLFVVDEAYQPLFDDDVAAVSPSGNVLVLRSLTKVFALPGLRLGYLLAAPRIARLVQAALPPWNVSTPAQAAGIAAAAEFPRGAPAIRGQIRALRESLRGRLEGMGAVPQGTGGTFLLYARADAADFCGRLFAHGVRVRHAASFGLPHYIRIGVRNEADNLRLVEAWQAVSESVAASGA